MGEEGRVKIKVWIDAQSMPSQAHIGSSSGYPRLDAAALEAVSRWRFRPARRNGLAEAMWASIPINFALESPEPSPSDWTIQAASALRAYIEPYGSALAHAQSPARFLVSIRPDGSVAGKALQTASGVPEWDRLSATALDRARFPPNAYGLIPSKAMISIASTGVHVKAFPCLQDYQPSPR